MQKPSRADGASALTALALALATCACSPGAPSDASGAARAAMEAARDSPPPGGLLSPDALAQAKQGVLRGYREDATRLSIHYFLSNYENAPDYRLWLARAAATGSSEAIEHYTFLLSIGKTPGDCAEARVLFARAKTLYVHEIAAAKAKNLRDAKIEALEALRDRERDMAHGACGR